MRKERKRPGELERRPGGNSSEIHERRPNQPDIRSLRGRVHACVILRIVCCGSRPINCIGLPTSAMKRTMLSAERITDRDGCGVAVDRVSRATSLIVLQARVSNLHELLQAIASFFHDVRPHRSNVIASVLYRIERRVRNKVGLKPVTYTAA